MMILTEFHLGYQRYSNQESTPLLSGTVSSFSTGFFPLHMKKELTVSAERVDPRESSIDVGSMWKSVLVLSVLYYLRYCLRNR